MIVLDEFAVEALHCFLVIVVAVVAWLLAEHWSFVASVLELANYENQVHLLPCKKRQLAVVLDSVIAKRLNSLLRWSQRLESSFEVAEDY